MYWDEFYENFYKWSDKTRASRISKLASFGPSYEVAAIITDYYDEVPATLLATKAMDCGVRFTSDEIMEMLGSVDEACMNRMVTTAIGTFSPQEITELELFVAADVYDDLRSEYCDEEEEDDFEDEEETAEEPVQKHSEYISSTLGLMEMRYHSASNEKRQSFHIGDRVRVRYRGSEGVIIDINGDLYMVSMNDGKRVDSYTKSQLEKL